MAKKKKTNQEEAPKVHEELKGFDLKINEFGELSSSLNVDEINKFLNKNVEDKKLMEKQEKDNKSDDSDS